MFYKVGTKVTKYVDYFWKEIRRLELLKIVQSGHTAPIQHIFPQNENVSSLLRICGIWNVSVAAKVPPATILDRPGIINKDPCMKHYPILRLEREPQKSVDLLSNYLKTMAKPFDPTTIN